MKKSDIFFLILFIILVFLPIPVFSLFREQIGYKNTENKAEEPFPELSSQNFSSWPRRFEEWLSDTLPFKTQFIELFRGFQLQTGLDFTQSDVIRGKDDYLFYRKTVENYKGITRFTDEELQKIEENLTGFFGSMKDRGVQCLLYIAPDKEQVYDEKMPETIRRISQQSMADQLTEALKDRVDFPVLYPKYELREISREIPIYFNTDTHWNNLGGWVASRQVKAAFSGTPPLRDFPDFHSYESEGKDLAGMLGLSERLPENYAVDIDFNDGLELFKTQTINYGSIQRYTTNDRPDGIVKKLMIIGDSFSEYFLRSAVHDIKDILFVTYGDLQFIDFESEIPDYLVIMLVERNLPFLLQGIN